MTRLRPSLVALALAWAGLPAAAATLHVAPGGSDLGPGTAARPFATLERARDEVRRLRDAGSWPKEGVTVELAAGTYERVRPFELTADDRGEPGAPVVYRAAAGAVVRLVGGRVVKGWGPVTDPAVRARLDEPARAHVVRADLRALGVTDFGDVAATGRRLELFVDDRPMTVARWPDEGFVKIADALGPTPVDVRGTKGRQEGVVSYEGDRPKRWVGETDLWVHGYWFWDWAAQRQAVDKLDPEKRVLTLRPPHHGYGYRKGQWFYAFNALAELDRPGEWYLDRRNGSLYVWPPSPLKEGSAVVSVVPTLVALRGCSNVTLRGLTLEACRDTAVTAADVRDVTIAGCTIRNTGRDAVSLSGRDSRVVGCDITATAAGGISLQGGDRPTLTPGRLVADNNYIHHYSRWERVYQPGVTLAGVGNAATHNRIDHAPHMAIGFSGNDHRIERNEVFEVCTESNDAGAVYAGRDWTMRGTSVRENYFHDIQGFERNGCVGVYLDDQFSGTEITGNLFVRVTRAAMIGGGRDCTIANNVFVDCVPATHVDARGLGWAADGRDGLVRSLQALPCKQPPWSDRYPKLVTILDDDPMAPKGNTIARNVCVGGRWGDFEEKARPLVTFTDNLVDTDPHFVDPAHGDYRLKPDSPAFGLGFRPLPLGSIGPYRDPLRASWPLGPTTN